MNFLEICQETDRILASQGVILSTITTGYQDLLVGYVANAYTDIQNMRDSWKFLHTSVDITLVQGKSSYSIFDIFATSTDPVSDWETMRFIYDDGSKKTALRYVLYEQYVLEDWTDQTEPSKFTVGIESNTLIFNQPNAAYTVTAHYHSKPQVLVNNTDTPLLPREYTTAIYYQAASDIAYKLGFYGIYQLFSVKADVSIGNLLRSQNPTRKIRTRGIA